MVIERQDIINLFNEHFSPHMTLTPHGNTCIGILLETTLFDYLIYDSQLSILQHYLSYTYVLFEEIMKMNYEENKIIRFKYYEKLLRV